MDDETNTITQDKYLFYITFTLYNSLLKLLNPQLLATVTWCNIKCDTGALINLANMRETKQENLGRIVNSNLKNFDAPFE